VFAINHDPFWFKAAYGANAAGVLMAIVAALPGFLDWALGIPRGTKARQIGLRHMVLNVTALAVFIINLFAQYNKWNVVNPDATSAIVLSAIGFQKIEKRRSQNMIPRKNYLWKMQLSW
jgi:uncharacterized membrane protein